MRTLSEIYKSLAEETRLRLLVILQGGKEYCVCHLMYALDMPQSTISRHLAYLKKYGWLRGRRKGIWMHYSLNENLDAFFQAQLVLIINQLADSDICRMDKKRLAERLANEEASECL
jgi:ArsR family transcriptional regulator, arsenate/arsenite/antimonite-responsive transcriptional repressor